MKTRYMPPAGERYIRNDREHTARVLATRDAWDRIYPDWHSNRLNQLRAARGAVRHG